RLLKRRAPRPFAARDPRLEPPPSLRRGRLTECAGLREQSGTAGGRRQRPCEHAAAGYVWFIRHCLPPIRSTRARLAEFDLPPESSYSVSQLGDPHYSGCDRSNDGRKRKGSSR